MLDRSVWAQCSAKLLHRGQRLHSLPPATECGISRIHALSFRGQSEAVCAWQEIKVCKGQLGAEQVILTVRQLALHHLQSHLDFWEGVRDHLLVRRNPKLG